MAKQKKNANYQTEKNLAEKARIEEEQQKKEQTEKIKTIAIISGIVAAVVALIFGFLFAVGVFKYHPEETGHASMVIEDYGSFHVELYGNVKAKLDLIEFCHRENIPVISSMGTGNRLNCTGFVIDKVEKTAGNGCGLSKVMRQELKKRGITGHTSLFNTRPPESKAVNSSNGRNAPGSCPFAPNVAGLMVAQYVVSQLL